MTSSTGKRTIFVDTETITINREHREIWELGLIVRDPGKPDVEYEWQLLPDLTHSDEVALRIGGYYQRNRLAIGGDAFGEPYRPGTAARIIHPNLNDGREVPATQIFALETAPVARLVHELAAMFAGAQIVGFCPWFDEHALWRLLRQHGQALVVDYHLVDGQSMARGFAGAAARWAPDSWIDEVEGRRAALDRVQDGPGWTSADLGLVCGVPAPADRHRALVDARWVRDVVDAVTGYQRPF